MAKKLLIGNVFLYILPTYYVKVNKIRICVINEESFFE